MRNSEKIHRPIRVPFLGKWVLTGSQSKKEKKKKKGKKKRKESVAFKKSILFYWGGVIDVFDKNLYIKISFKLTIPPHYENVTSTN